MPYTFDQAASLLNVGRNNMTKLLRTKGVLDTANRPQGRYSGAGLFVVANGSYKHPEKGRVPYQKTLVTDSGITLIDGLLQQEKQSKPTLH